jgi:hypothetical protein
MGDEGYPHRTGHAHQARPVEIVQEPLPTDSIAVHRSWHRDAEYAFRGPSLSGGGLTGERSLVEEDDIAEFGPRKLSKLRKGGLNSIVLFGSGHLNFQQAHGAVEHITPPLLVRLLFKAHHEDREGHVVISKTFVGVGGSRYVQLGLWQSSGHERRADRTRSEVKTVQNWSSDHDASRYPPQRPHIASDSGFLAGFQ